MFNKPLLSFLCLLLIGFFSSLLQAVDFDRYELKLDLTISRPVLSASLVKDNAGQLIVFGQDQRQQTWLVLFQMQNDHQYQEISRRLIPDQFLAYDLLKGSETQRLIFQTNQALFAFDPHKNDFSLLASSGSIYRQPKAQYLATRDFTRDVNDDGLEDIVISDFSGVHFLLQTVSGSFEQQTLPVKPQVRTNQNSATFTETPLYFADFNQDKKQDLAVLRNDALEVFYQNGHGVFETAYEQLALPVKVHEQNWWEVREADGESLDQNDLSYRTIFKIKDLNNDNVSDLLIRFSQSEGVFDRQNSYEIYLGKVSDGIIQFATSPDSVIIADGTIAEVNIVDLDDDLRDEVLVSSLDIGLTQIIGALLSGSIDQDVMLFKLGQDGKFNKKPSVSKEVELSFSLSSGKSGEPVVELADFDGDGLKDLMFSDGSKTLKIYRGKKGKKLFTRRASKQKVRLPKDGKLLETFDLNLDGKNDIMIRYGRQDDTELKNKLVYLIAR